MSQFYALLVEARLMALRGGRTSQAARIARVIDRFSADLTQAAVLTAEVADREIKKRAQMRVRPEDPSAPAGAMARAVRSLALPPVGRISLGGVEIGLHAALDAVPYWRAQEYGSAHLVGRRMFGTFEPGGYRPTASRYRMEASFRGGVGAPRGGGFGAKIKNPIPAKHFLRDGTDVAFAEWSRLVNQASVRAARALGTL